MAPVIGLIITGEHAVQDFKVFAKTLEVWHPDAHAYIFTDSDTKDKLLEVKSRITLHLKVCLDAYAGLTRSDMEARPGIKYDSLFKDYTYEKAGVLRWIFETTGSKGVWFMDADIIHCAPLPHIPDGTELALSQHMIRASDERMYGTFNAGYFWIAEQALIDVWIAAADKSRFYEQAALEDVAAAAKTLYRFPPQVNFGWWRMYQAAEAPPAIQAKFSINRTERSIGLRYDNPPIQSFHSQMFDRTTSANGVFNRWLDAYSARFAGAHPPLRVWRKSVGF